MFPGVKPSCPGAGSPVVMACSHTGYCSVCGLLDFLSPVVLACGGRVQ